MQSSPQEFDRTAVITLQGGGLYGLSVLGQLAALIYQYKIDPLALAGTSAGAIVATLYWAGYTPKQIRNLFIQLARKGEFASILGPFDPPDRPFDYDALREIWRRCELDATWATQELVPKRELFFIRWGKWPGRARRAWSGVKTVTAGVTPHLPNLGLFSGRKLEQVLDEWIRSSPKIKPHADEIPPAPELLQFRHLQDLSKRHPSLYFPPLFLAATNLTTRQLEIFNSVDTEYQNVPIAQAVRASSGVPLFFRPVLVNGGPRPGWYVDGGLVSNFPAWVFADEIRTRLAKSADHYGLVSRPWVHIGLRLQVEVPAASTDPLTPHAFGAALIGLLTGHARNQLEDILASKVGRSLIVRQPYSQTGGPASMLALEEVDEDKIRAMVDKGREWAEQDLAALSFALPEASAVEAILSGLVQAALRIFQPADDSLLHLRSNVFLPCGKSLILTYSYNMAGDPDRNLKFIFTSGLTGWCFTTRMPVICNLQKIRQLAQRGSLQPEDLFGMTPEEHLNVRQDRTWLASVPIFDPTAMYPRDLADEPSSGQPRLGGRHYHQLSSPMDGAVFGVLNLDAALPYGDLGLEEDPDLHRSDPRIHAIMGVLQTVSLDLGSVFSQHFAVNGV